MKVYILTDKDFEKLSAEVDRDPRHGPKGGSGQALSKEEEQAFQKAHRFYNFVTRKWIQQMKEDPG